MSAIGDKRPPEDQRFETINPRGGSLNGGMHYGETLTACQNIIKSLSGCFQGCCNDCCRNLQCCATHKYTKSTKTTTDGNVTTHIFESRTDSSWMSHCNCCTGKKGN